MPDAPFTEAEVRDLIAAKKYIHRVMEDNRGQPNANEIRLTYEIRRRGNETGNLHLRLFARLEKQVNAAVVKPQPGVSLLWCNKRIRCICWRLRHDIIRDGRVIGFVRHWHEKQWTDPDEDKFIIDANDFVKKNIDFASLIYLCLRRWNIETSEQYQMEI
ncbi:MAG: hypothetical protein H0U18_11100 [Pyrinomonadaceae bacterium]|nr:hypothetical protein [Pyrinomonadaceae bacterium]